MQSLHQIPIPTQADNYSLRINDDLFSSQTPGQVAGGVPQLWQLHGGHPEGHPRGPPQVRADHNIIWWCDDLMWWPQVPVWGHPGGVSVRGRWLHLQGPQQEGQGTPGGVRLQEGGWVRKCFFIFLSPRSLKMNMHVQELLNQTYRIQNQKSILGHPVHCATYNVESVWSIF